MTDLFLALGSNLGNRRDNLHRALTLLAERVGEVCECSDVEETEPWGYHSEHTYLNAVAHLRTELGADAVLTAVQAIERELGRTVKTGLDLAYSDRTLDIDILFHGRSVVYSPTLRIPHPRMWQRDFVMKPLRAIAHMPTVPFVATIGFFDGVHLGHRHLLAQLRDLADASGQQPLAVTFDRHPASVVPGRKPTPVLSSRNVCINRLLGSGLEVAELQFDTVMAQLSARNFMRSVLREQLNVDTLLVGYDHHFGQPIPQRPESIADYKAYGHECGIDVVVATELPSGQHVSSSAIRRSLLDGNVTEAAAMLGRAYEWTGRVVHGNAIGRQIGFPTANLEAVVPEQLLPARGVYAVKVMIGDEAYPAMMNIGTRPTIDPSEDTPTVEVHVFSYSGDLYGSILTVSFIHRLRREQRFGSEDELKAQLEVDRDEALRAVEEYGAAETNSIHRL